MTKCSFVSHHFRPNQARGCRFRVCASVRVSACVCERDIIDGYKFLLLLLLLASAYLTQKPTKKKSRQFHNACVDAHIRREQCAQYAIRTHASSPPPPPPSSSSSSSLAVVFEWKQWSKRRNNDHNQCNHNSNRIKIKRRNSPQIRRRCRWSMAIDVDLMYSSPSNVLWFGLRLQFVRCSQT